MRHPSLSLLRVPVPVFFKSLSILTLLSGVLLFVLHRLIPAAHVHGYFAVSSLLLFVCICIGLYFAGVQARQSSNQFAFSNLISVSVFGKMVISLGFLLVYKQLMHPANQWFVGIFLVCYVIYTSFEVWFMTKLGK